MKALLRRKVMGDVGVAGLAALCLSGCFVSTTGSLVERNEPDASVMDAAVDGMRPPDARVMDAALDASVDATLDAIVIPDADGATTWVPPEGWWDAGWRRRYGIVIDTDRLTRALNDVPVMIELRPDRIDYALAGEEGRSLRFVLPTDGGGEELDFEIERWDPAGSSVVWVRIPVLTMGSRFRIQLYLDNPDASTRAGEGWVWDGDFRGVWHLSGDLRDATGFGNNGVGDGASSRDGRVAGALGFGRGDEGVVADDDSLDFESGVTISAWVRPEGGTHHRGVLSKRVGCGSRANYALFITRGGEVQFEYHSGQWRVWRGGEVPMDVWTHVAATMDDDDNRLRLYVNGREVRSDDSANQDLRVDDNPIEIGGNGGCSNDFFEGGLDEIRLSADDRSSAWIWFEHHMVQPGAVLFEPAEGEGV